MASHTWLPALVLLEKYGGDWQKYLDAIYAYFKTDFIESRPIYDGKRVGLKRHPLSQGKEATFWHLISEGDIEKDRIPDMRRCERIRWPRPIIEHSGEKVLKVWKNVRNGETRICLWLESEEYLVVLAERKDHVLPWTAYMVDREHRKQKLQKEFEEYWKKKKP